MEFPHVEQEADRLARLPVAEARVELGRMLNRATDGGGRVDAFALDFNARLVTALRERKTRIWGD